MYLYLTTRLLGHNPASTRYVTGSPGLPQRASRPLEQTCVCPTPRGNLLSLLNVIFS